MGLSGHIVLFVVMIRYKGDWWMPTHDKAMKDVATCEKLRGGGKQPLIRRYPNGATLPNKLR